MKSRILVAVVGIPALLYVVLAAPSIVMLAALCVLAGIGAMELQRCVSGVKRSELAGMGIVTAACWIDLTACSSWLRCLRLFSAYCHRIEMRR